MVASQAAVLVLVLVSQQFTPLVPPAEGVRPGNQFALVVDQSGSMDPNRVTKSIEAVLAVSQQSTDDMEVCLFGFTSKSTKWHASWKKLPSAEVVLSLGHWLRDNKPAFGSTFLKPALLHALKAEKKNLTVVVISDGLFDYERKEQLLEALEEGQKAREKNKLPRAVVITICVGSENILATYKMKALGKAGKGGCYLWTDKLRPSATQPTKSPSKQ